MNHFWVKICHQCGEEDIHDPDKTIIYVLLYNDSMGRMLGITVLPITRLFELSYLSCKY